VLDGEVAVYDANLVSRFHLLGDPGTGILYTPPVFIAFDVLQRGNRDLRRVPLSDRRTVLEAAAARRRSATRRSRADAGA
jgi:ATP-dependent DNA ligase